MNSLLCDHLANLLARGFEQGCSFFDGQDFIVRHSKTSINIGEKRISL